MTWPPESGPPHLEVRGGPADPASAHVVDIDAVHHASVRYRAAADEMAAAVAVLRGVARDLPATVRIVDPASLLTRPVAAFGLWRLAERLEEHVADRRALADRVRAAAILYRQVDETNAARLRRLLAGEDPLVSWANPWVLERQGLCSTSTRPLRDAESYAPVCPGASGPEFHPEVLYRPQILAIDGVVSVWSRARPGLAGLLQAVHDGYAARTPDGADKADAVDVRKRTYRGPDGRPAESYLVALPGTSRWDVLDVGAGESHRFRSLRPNLEGVAGWPSAEARILPEVLAAAGVPDGAEVVLVGHSQGGMTAMAAAALPAMRRYRLHVVTAGSPVGRAPVVPSVQYLHVENRGDVVPGLDNAPNRSGPDRVTVTTGRARLPGEAHAVDSYVEESERIDVARTRGRLDPSLDRHLESLDRAGHLAAPGDGSEIVTTRVFLRRR